MARHPGKAGGPVNLEVTLFGLPLISLSWSRVDPSKGGIESVELGTYVEEPEADPDFGFVREGTR